MSANDNTPIYDRYKDTHYGLRIMNAFRRDEGVAGTEYTFNMPGVRNPIQITPTPGFVFATFTRLGYPIDEVLGGSVKMGMAAEIK